MKHLSPRALTALLLLPLPLFGSCVVAAAGVAGALVTNEFTSNASLAFLEEDLDHVWNTAKETMQRRSLDAVQIDEQTRALRANVDGATVTVQVARYDGTQIRLAVSAKKWGFYDADQANTIITLIKKEIDR
ncbi:MAG: hypothetical protein O2816_09335 [Planctomycetota bacterium]|nr:hypothetical protein [Planctomycetota bacterium]